MDIKITNAQLVDGPDSPFIRAFMNDGSIWQCDTNGNNWVKVVPNTVDLNALFNARGT